MSDSRIGVDESGKGDYFGPLVIAAVYVGPEHLAELEGLQESKKSSDKMSIAWASKIKAVCPHEVILINPARYNDLYDKIGNLNKLLSWGHARAIENMVDKVDCKTVIADQFANAEYMRKALMKKGSEVDFTARVRAEDDTAVAAASILARAAFLQRLASLGAEIGIELPKGASDKVIQTAVKIAARDGMAALRKVAKIHFKTTIAVRQLAEGANPLRSNPS